MKITAAAVTAFIGGSLFVLFGFLSGYTLGKLFHSVSEKYPGLTFNQTDSPAPYFEILLMGVVGAALVLGVLGVVTGIGLLRIRRWARLSMIAWPVLSTLACFVELVHAGPHSEFHINPAFVYGGMLIIVPVNSWLLLLLLRPATKAVFQPLAVSARIAQARSPMTRVLVTTGLVAAVFVLAAAALGWLKWWTSPMREIERSRVAVARAKS